jgi:hypothetical protein
MATSNHANRSNSPAGANRPGPANPARLPARGANRHTAGQMPHPACSFLGALMASRVGKALLAAGGAAGANRGPQPPARPVAVALASAGARAAGAAGACHPGNGAGPCPAGAVA